MNEFELIKRLEAGERVKIPVDATLLQMLQAVVNCNYAKFTLDVKVIGKKMRLRKVGEVVRLVRKDTKWF